MKNINDTEEKNKEGMTINCQTETQTENGAEKPTADAAETQAETSEKAQDEAEDGTGKKKKNWKSELWGWILLLLVAACISFTGYHLVGLIFTNDDDEADEMEYVEEPGTSSIARERNEINIVNPVTQEVIVKDIEWYHGGDDSKDSIVLFAKNGKRGFCNFHTNKVIVQPTTYTKAWQFSEGLAAVEKDGYIGFINTEGKVVIGFRFPYRGNSLCDFVFHNGRCVVADSSNRIGAINKNGRWVVKPLYDDVELTKEYAIVYKEGDFKKQIDYQGNVLQDGIIDYICDIYYSVSYTNLETGEPMKGEMRNPDFYEYRVGGKAGLINSSGQYITKPIYTSVTGVSKTLFRATLQDYHSTVFIDRNGNVISGKSHGQKK